MATGTLAGAPWFTGLDDNGNPVANGKLFTYAAGTTTKLATYSDVGLTTPNANPTILDAGGRATLYLSPGSSYKFVLSPSTDTDPPTNPIKTADNISAIPTSSSNLEVQGGAGEAIAAGQGVYLSDGSGGKTAGLWYLWDADFTYASTLPEIGMAVAAIASLATGTIRQAGQITGLTGLTVGTTYYVSATAGALTATAPTNARFVGVADSTTSIIIAPNPPQVLTSVTQTTTSTGSQNNFALTRSPKTFLRCNNATDLTLTGITAGVDGDLLQIVSVGAGNVLLAHQNASSTAANRLQNMATSGNTPLATGKGTATYVYDGTSAYWRLLTHDQGAWITPTFTAGDYTATGGGSWTVASGDVITYAYLLRGKTLSVNYKIVTTTVATTASSLDIKIPGGFTSNQTLQDNFVGNDNAAALGVKLRGIAIGGTKIVHNSTITGSGWNAATDTTEVDGTITFEVQ